LNELYEYEQEVVKEFEEEKHNSTWNCIGTLCKQDIRANREEILSLFREEYNTI